MNILKNYIIILINIINIFGNELIAQKITELRNFKISSSDSGLILRYQYKTEDFRKPYDQATLHIKINYNNIERVKSIVLYKKVQLYYSEDVLRNKWWIDEFNISLDTMIKQGFRITICDSRDNKVKIDTVISEKNIKKENNNGNSKGEFSNILNKIDDLENMFKEKFKTPGVKNFYMQNSLEYQQKSKEQIQDWIIDSISNKVTRNIVFLKLNWSIGLCYNHISSFKDYFGIILFFEHYNHMDYAIGLKGEVSILGNGFFSYKGGIKGIQGYGGIKFNLKKVFKESITSNFHKFDLFVDFGGIYCKYQPNLDSTARYISGYGDTRIGVDLIQSINTNWKIYYGLFYYSQTRELLNKREVDPYYSDNYWGLKIGTGFEKIWIFPAFKLIFETYYLKQDLNRFDNRLFLLFNFQ